METKGEACLTYGTLFRGSYGHLALVLAGTAILTAGNISLRWGIGEALDSGNLRTSLLLIAGTLLALTQMISYVRQILSAKVRKNLYIGIQSKVLHGSMESLGKSNLGAVTACYTADIDQIDIFANRILGKAFPDLAAWLITVAMMFVLDVYLGIAAVFVTVVPVLFLHRMSRPVAKGSSEFQAALEKANQSVVTGLYNLESVKASCQEEAFIRDNDEKLADLLKKKRKVALWQALLGAPMLIGAFGTIVLLTAFSGWLALQSRITAGQMLTVVALTDNIVAFVMSLDGTISAFRRASVSLGRLSAFLGQEEERKDGREVGRIREIAFRDICFAYPGSDRVEEEGSMEERHSMEERNSREIYGGLSDVWQQGEIVFLKGGNGEGKSTLIKLLMGIYDVASGQISINGIPMQEYSLISLRERIVAVPQENILFQGSIRDNLACGKDISPEQIEEVCRKVGIYEEILRMPERYETMLTENGGALSGGQKQRLCLARALLREGDVYLFDEPTSALDRENREHFAGVVQELSKDKIVVVITHERELPDGAQRVTKLGTT